MAYSKKPIKTHFFIFFKIPLQPTHYFSFSDRQPNSPSTTCGGLRRSLPPLPSRSEMGNQIRQTQKNQVLLPSIRDSRALFEPMWTQSRRCSSSISLRGRYEWFGKENDCLLLGEKEMLERFIDRDEILEQQMRVFATTPAEYCKVILATNITKTSVTIPGIKYVIDPGLVKARSYDPKQGLESLTVVPISKARALQRRDHARKPGSNNSPIPWEGNSRIGGYRHRPNKALLICLRD
ncbi:hypothetical protein CsatA_015769 [Cannabis sativa]